MGKANLCKPVALKFFPQNPQNYAKTGNYMAMKEWHVSIFLDEATSP